MWTRMFLYVGDADRTLNVFADDDFSHIWKQQQYFDNILSLSSQICLTRTKDTDGWNSLEVKFGKTVKFVENVKLHLTSKCLQWYSYCSLHFRLTYMQTKSTVLRQKAVKMLQIQRFESKKWTQWLQEVETEVLLVLRGRNKWNYSEDRKSLV